MTHDERQEFLKILRAHAETIAVCEACATTTRDLAAEVRRGGAPAHDALELTVSQAEQALVELGGVRAEVERLMRALE